VKRTCPHCQKTVSFWNFVKPGLWGSDIVICKNCQTELTRLWTLESIGFVAILFIAQAAGIFLAGELLNFGFYTNLIIFISFIFAAMLIIAGTSYYVVSFKKKGK